MIKIDHIDKSPRKYGPNKLFEIKTLKLIHSQLLKQLINLIFTHFLPRINHNISKLLLSNIRRKCRSLLLFLFQIEN